MTSQIHQVNPTILSVISHGQLNLVCNLLSDLEEFGLTDISIVLTINISEDEAPLARFAHLPIHVIRNVQPKGFGDNHNSAFRSSVCDYFVIVNPDIRLTKFSIDALLAPFVNTDIGAVAPVVLSPSGSIEDSARRFPSLCRLFKRVALRQRKSDYQWSNQPVDIDWAAGMFVVFRAEAFKMICGFDTKYFMYMEDADICRRLKMAGWRTVLIPTSWVIHDARRASRRSFRHLRWHIASAFRFLLRPVRKL